MNGSAQGHDIVYVRSQARLTQLAHQMDTTEWHQNKLLKKTMHIPN